ncbi:MAG TPA: MerR family transcriptional regulator [Thermomicrobiales bacterium]|nr:MerR family transcriptional regulator [Thermomicrobiales bacterium]
MEGDRKPAQTQGYRSIGQVVAEIQRTYPDVSHSSLRFLEREGLLNATRTAGGHRLYSAEDVDRVRTIKRWQEQRLSLREIRERLLELDRLPVPSVLAEESLQRLVAGDLEAARQSLLSAADVGLSLEVLFGDVIQRVLIEVGNRWQAGDLMVAQEKEISELMREVIVELTLRSAGTATGPRLVAACVEGERHELGLRMVCGILRAREYDVRFLGADVAPRFLVEAMRLHHPVAVLLSATLPERLGAVEAAIEALGSLSNEDAPPSVIVGGPGIAGESGRVRSLGAIPVAESHPAAAATEVVGIVPTAVAARGS